MTPQVTIRYNAGNRWGLGHHYRCRLLGRELQKNGISVRFATNDDPFFDEHSSESDIRVSAPETVRATEDDATALLIDLPLQISGEQLSAYSGKLICLDQYGPLANSADLVINSIAHPHARKPACPQLYTGPAFMILDPALMLPAKPLTAPPGRILISMGGSDPHNITAAVADALVQSLPELKFRLLAGPAFNATEELDKRAERWQNLELLTGGSAETVAESIAWADIGVFSFGLTVYAAAHAGLPCLVVGHDSDGARAADTFASETGACISLGEHYLVAVDKLKQEFAALVSDSELQKQMHERGKRAVDGRGLARVVELIVTSIG